MLEQVEIGDEVFWNDPDAGVCSGHGKVVEIGGLDEDSIITLQMNDGGEVECFLRELS